jgi:RNA polymerase sigma-32 factor
MFENIRPSKKLMRGPCKGEHIGAPVSQQLWFKRRTIRQMGRIRASIQEYVLRSRSLVKIVTTANQKKLFFNLRKAKSEISASKWTADLAAMLRSTCRSAMTAFRRMAGLAGRRHAEPREGAGWTEDFDIRRKALVEALTVLNSRERRVFEARRLGDEPITLKELAEEFGVSRERVRQIEMHAFKKVQNAVRRQVAAMERLEAPAAHWGPIPVSGTSHGIGTWREVGVKQPI